MKVTVYDSLFARVIRRRWRESVGLHALFYNVYMRGKACEGNSTKACATSDIHPVGFSTAVEVKLSLCLTN
jgi:hypothetical protein